jgi:hypothetical protein
VSRSLPLLVLIGAAIATSPSASARPNDPVAIRPGVGIGPVNLGMTGQAVRRALGKPRTVIERRVLRGQPYIEFEWDYGAWNVGLLGPASRRRVVLIGTGLSRHKSPEGVGVGTKENQFWRRVRGEGFRQRSCPRPELLHWVARRGRTETIFFPTWREYPGEATINGAEVRASPTLGCGF